MIFTPAPGIFVIKYLKDTQSGILTGGKQTKIKQGEVIERGKNPTTDFGTILTMDEYANVGDKVLFLTYDGEYDLKNINGQDYYFVKAQDMRSVIHE